MKKFVAIIKMAVIESLSYRGDIFLFVVSGIIAPLLMLAVWLTVSTSGGTPPMSVPQIINYFVLIMFVEVVNSAWSSPYVARDIRLGKLSTYLVKPFNYMVWFAGQNLGEKCLKLIYLIPLLSLLTVLFQKNIDGFVVTNVMFFIPALILAVIITFIFDFIIGVSAFWIQDVKPLRDLQDVCYFVLSGKIIPLIALPAILHDVNELLPFRYMLSFPVEIIINSLTFSEMIFGFLTQLFWLSTLLTVYIIMWHKGLKKYSAVGA